MKVLNDFEGDSSDETVSMMAVQLATLSLVYCMPVILELFD